jgi:glycosyltransferase involved in cell wall biosynthesis
MASAKSGPIVQCIREIGPGGGVSGVAYAIESSLQKRSIQVQRFTLANCGFLRSQNKTESLWVKKGLHLFDVIYFSLIGTILAKWQTERARVISHNDAVYGAVFVNHGLHCAMLDASGRKWRMLLRNPIHLFLIFRENLRFRLDVHDHYVCFSDSEKQQLIRYYPGVAGKIRIIPNGVDIERFTPNTAERTSTRAELKISDDTFVMIFLGHEFERKGLFAAISSLCYLAPDTQLIVAGGTNEEIQRGKLFATTEGVADRVIFLGVIRSSEKYLRAADCLVLPSLFEAWPLVGLEAMACGVPALMTAVGGIPDYLTDGLNGYIITRQPKCIAEKVTCLRANREDFEKMKSRCIDTASHYAWDKIVDQYVVLLH